jgi:hypothetical protein
MTKRPPPPNKKTLPLTTLSLSTIPHRLTQRSSLIGTVLTNVIIDTPAPSVIVIALLLGSIALAVTGTDSTAVHSHSLDTGLLWMLFLVLVFWFCFVGGSGVACV